MIEQMTLSFVVAPDGSLPGAGDTVQVYAADDTEYTVHIRSVLSQTEPLDGVVVLTVLAEREPCSGDHSVKSEQFNVRSKKVEEKL